MARINEASLETTARPPEGLQAGQAAPLFSLPDADMETVDLAQFRGRKSVVLYFYPKDGTPSCTLLATDFSDHEDEFARQDCVVLGVSPDDCLRHADFRDQRSRKSRITRSTFIIDKSGTVTHVFYGVTPRGHAAEVLGLVKSLR